MALAETHASRLRAWRKCDMLLQCNEECFDAISWLAIHAGEGHWPACADPVLAACQDKAEEIASAEFHFLPW